VMPMSQFQPHTLRTSAIYKGKRKRLEYIMDFFLSNI
jgi:hypothetical protein